ncbi:MAG: DUF6527 family protein [Candidatus Thiodiazotropha endolucinida]
MMRYTRLEHRFVQHIPDEISPGVLFISMEYGIAAHSCCCGCGEEVVTPFTPTDWKMTFDGETVSLHPSIGNWSLACKSHYVIRQGRVIEAGQWTDEQVVAEHRRDRAAKAQYYGTATSHNGLANHANQSQVDDIPGRFWQRLWYWVKGKLV